MSKDRFKDPMSDATTVINKLMRNFNTEFMTCEREGKELNISPKL